MFIEISLSKIPIHSLCFVVKKKKELNCVAYQNAGESNIGLMQGVEEVNRYHFKCLIENVLKDS